MSPADVDDWIYWVTGGGRDRLAVLGVFLDESHRREHDWFMAAGLLFYQKRGQSFARKWLKLFPKGFHATKFNSPAISDEDRAKLLVAAFLIAKYVDSMPITVCSAATAAAVFGHGRHAEDKAYIVCAAIAAFGVSEHLRKKGRNEKVAYVYDRKTGDGQRTLKGFLEKIASIDYLADYYRLGAVTSDESLSSPHLQAADYVIWEFGKNLEREKDGLPKRENFNLLLNLWESKPGRQLAYSRPTELRMRAFSDWLDGLVAQAPEGE